MSADSKIEWTHHTFNPWWGCTHVSPGCEHCYAETFAKRVGQKVWGVSAERRFFGEKHWREPLKWNAAAEKAGERHRVFCASMADVFEDRPELVTWRRWLWKLIEDTPHLDWLLLTKRPENIAGMLPDHQDALAWPYHNVWLGTTAEDQQRANERIPRLLRVPAAVHFLSVEPQLGPVDLEAVPRGTPINGFDQRFGAFALWQEKPTWTKLRDGIDWVIVGGESGHGARPFDLAWARSLVQQCSTAGVACFVKQLGGAAVDARNGLAGASLKVDPDATALISRRLVNRKGGDWTEWPPDLLVRQFPRAVKRALAAQEDSK